MNVQLSLATKGEFESIMEQPNVVVKNSHNIDEYVTAVYKDGELVAERVMYLRQVEHFVIGKTRPELKGV